MMYGKLIQLIELLGLKGMFVILMLVLYIFIQIRYISIKRRYELLNKEYLAIKQSLIEERKKVMLLEEQLKTVNYFKQKNKELQKDRENLSNKIDSIIKPDNKERISYEEQKKVIKVFNNIFNDNNTAHQP